MKEHRLLHGYRVAYKTYKKHPTPEAASDLLRWAVRLAAISGDYQCLVNEADDIMAGLTPPNQTTEAET